MLIVVPIALLFLIAGIGLFRSRPPAEPGTPAPNFALLDLETRGREVELAELRGRPVVLNFWASWCDPCREEAPQLAEAARSYADEVQFLGVNILDGREEALRFVAEEEVPYPSVRDPGGRVSRMYRVTGVPETVFVDPDGRIVGTYVGAFKPGELDGLVRELLALEEGETLDIVGSGDTRPVP